MGCCNSHHAEDQPLSLFSPECCHNFGQSLRWMAVSQGQPVEDEWIVSEISEAKYISWWISFIWKYSDSHPMDIGSRWAKLHSMVTSSDVFLSSQQKWGRLLEIWNSQSQGSVLQCYYYEAHISEIYISSGPGCVNTGLLNFNHQHHVTYFSVPQFTANINCETEKFSFNPF